MGRTVDRIANATIDVIGEIVGHITEPNVPELLEKLMKTVVTFDDCELFVHSRVAAPVSVYTSCSPTCPRSAAISAFISETYRLSPFYRSFRKGLPTGVYRLRDLAENSGFEPQGRGRQPTVAAPAEVGGYLTVGWPAGRDEVCIAVELSQGECAEITLARASMSRCFDDQEIAALTSWTPLIAATFRRYWRQVRPLQKITGPDPRVYSRAALSPREREVAQLLLNGHSTLSVSLRLSISPTTVKTHRKNLYAKLGIATQFELFSLFNGSLGAN